MNGISRTYIPIPLRHSPYKFRDKFLRLTTVLNRGQQKIYKQEAVKKKVDLLLRNLPENAAIQYRWETFQFLKAVEK